MKKILKNKKGFTLIELLAVIVVLAIIMVIATQQVNKTIKKARSNSLFESMEAVVKSAKLLIAEGEDSSSFQDSLRASMDYSNDEYEIYGRLGTSGYFITVSPTVNGKFSNVNYSLIKKNSKYRYQSDGQICVIIKDDGELLQPTINCEGTNRPTTTTTAP